DALGPRGRRTPSRGSRPPVRQMRRGHRWRRRGTRSEPARGRSGPSHACTGGCSRGSRPCRAAPGAWSSRPGLPRVRAPSGCNLIVGPDNRSSVRPTMRGEGPDRFSLLASAIAGRLVEVAAGEPGERAWTDGATVFVDAAARSRDQLLSVAVQAALIGAGSLDAEVVRRLDRRPGLARRYLAVEGHRALAAQEGLL